MVAKVEEEVSWKEEAVVGDVGGVEKISSTRFKFMANGQDFLDGCDRASGGEVKGVEDPSGSWKEVLGGDRFLVLRRGQVGIGVATCTDAILGVSFNSLDGFLYPLASRCILVLLVQKLLLLVLKVNAAGIKVTTAERLQLLKG
ncbi:hypothetical protein Tco_0286242 [Tanacetum coccineum]